MKKSIKNYSLKIFVILFLCSFIFYYAPLALATNSATIFNSSLSNTGPNAGYNTLELNKAKNNLTSRASSIILLVLNFLGVFFLALMIYGGFVWMTARGEETRYQKAKDILIQALIGLIIISAAYAISYFIIKAVLPTLS